jgi:hypothetical protein
MTTGAFWTASSIRSKSSSTLLIFSILTWIWSCWDEDASFDSAGFSVVFAVVVVDVGVSVCLTFVVPDGVSAFFSVVSDDGVSVFFSVTDPSGFSVVFAVVDDVGVSVCLTFVVPDCVSAFFSVVSDDAVSVFFSVTVPSGFSVVFAVVDDVGVSVFFSVVAPSGFSLLAGGGGLLVFWTLTLFPWSGAPSSTTFRLPGWLLTKARRSSILCISP